MEKKPRPKCVEGTTTRIETGCGHLYVTVNKLDSEAFEVFASLGKTGGCEMAQSEAVTRMISTGLRYGVPVREYIKQLLNISCPKPAFNGEGKVQSCPDAIAKVLMQEMNLKPEDVVG